MPGPWFLTIRERSYFRADCRLSDKYYCGCPFDLEEHPAH